MKILLAGTYPDLTTEKLSAMLGDGFDIVTAETQQEYEAVTDADIMIIRVLKAYRDSIERIKGLKMIMRWGTGFDSVDIAAAGENGIYVTNTPGANSGAVSELVLMMMLALERKLYLHKEALSKGIWSKNDYMNESFCIKGKTVGTIVS